MHRYIFGVLIAWFAIPFDVVAADHIVRFPKRADHAQYSVIRMAARRSLITVKDSRADNGPETRGVIMRGGFDGGPVRIPDGHAVAIFAVSPAVNGSCGPIDLSFLDALGNNDLCELDVSQNFLTCQQVKSLSRFSRIVELRTFIDNDCNTPRCLDELKGLEVLVLAFRKEMDTRDSAGWVAAAVKHKSLRSLTLDGLRPNDEQMKKLVSLQKLECLQLNSSKSDVTNRGDRKSVG